MAVADVLDALTSQRPYKPAWPWEKALQWLQEQSGKHFWPLAVDALLRQESACRQIAIEWADAPSDTPSSPAA